jgi:hypothetical protein
MKRSCWIFLTGAFLFICILTACAPKSAPETVVEYVEVAKEVAVEKAVEAEAPAQPAAAGQGAAAENLHVNYQPPAVDRLIIKNAEITLEVESTDVAISRVTQVVTDVGGYIVSSQVNSRIVEEVSYKYGSVTFAVPVEQFERALGRLRDLAIKVVDEMATGEDVTDEFVDLESRLTNLKATRDRIREFLVQAKTVEEALKVNEQLSEVEDEIEKVQGRINYLSGRAAFSTITVYLQPQLPQLTPTPTPTVTPTPTPTPWKPGETFQEAGKSMGSIWRGVVDLSIWLGVVVLPCLVPIVLLGYLLWRLWHKVTNRKPPQTLPPGDKTG